MFFQLTAVPLGIVSLLIVIISYLIYSTACFLVDQMPAVQPENQALFENQLAVFLWWLTPAFIGASAFFYYFFSKKMTRPLQELVHTANELKAGQYPPIITTTSFREIDQLTQHLNELNERLKQNEESRNKMLTDMAHELRTPLSNINGYLEAMRDGVIQGDQPLFHSLHNESERLIDMINQIQEMANLNEQNSPTQTKNWVDIKAVLDDVMTMFQLKMENEQIPFTSDIVSKDLYINKEGIQQSVTNLLQNAIQYYDGSSPVKLVGYQADDYYLILVTGPGPPIPYEERKWLFERFYRVDSSRSRKTGGTGLGLAIVKDIIVTHHHGYVDLVSNNNIHTFSMRLPVNAIEVNNMP